MKKEITIALVDDHALLRNGLAGLLKNSGYTIMIEAGNGIELIEQMQQGLVPEVVLLDINMPRMDGYETAQWLRDHYPAVKVLALSMYDEEPAIIRMLRYGARGYILKDADASSLLPAIEDVCGKGFHYSEMVTGKLLHTIFSMKAEPQNTRQLMNLNDREMEFLKMVCSEMTYREIAEKMLLSPRTIDGYRDALFEKLQVKTRVGLAIYAIRNGLVHV